MLLLLFLKVIITSLAGLEPAIFHLGGGRVIHYATETYWLLLLLHLLL